LRVLWTFERAACLVPKLCVEVGWGDGFEIKKKMEILLSDLMHTLARVCTTSSGFLSGGSKSYSARGRDTSKELFHRRRMERRLSVQHSQGRMERTKNNDKVLEINYGVEH
jgi:hypothetical protein